ncbi:KOW domain-containing protein domain-containing protein [Arthroderma uncinatum]|uniref:KOW domain-containing protein domain-containing protein n=1 Tax=Arthroderma uncinatum TaxID=74035 RepID=UPI00144ADFC3|nr:KOW domain-containing protein domain-containing protein [Arthroderma uncinatum]KAF3491863.1 KOW domain-containing protein domain-containing protein [Arthroderma uncinatum]
MDKVLRRAALASNQAKRKVKATLAKDAHDKLKANLREKFAYNRNLLDEAIEERKTRREDWLKGPLAPKRNVGDRDVLYGTISTGRLRLPKVPEAKRVKYVTIAPGDRVCMVRGKDKGKIGKVLQIDEESQSVTIEGMNMFDVEFPSFALAGDNDSRPYRPYPAPNHFDDVRLVVPLQDPVTNTVKDVVVKHAYGAGPFLDRPYGSTTPRHTRYIAGADIEIPWPETEEPDFKDHPVDTLQIEVEAKTFLPSLQTYPMPSTVIDELRNKYSKFRTKHDPEYITAKEEEAAFSEWEKQRTLVSPKTEYMTKKVEDRRLQREQAKDEDGNFRLDGETANFIEQFMARKQQTGQRRTNAA